MFGLVNILARYCHNYDESLSSPLPGTNHYYVILGILAVTLYRTQTTTPGLRCKHLNYSVIVLLALSKEKKQERMQSEEKKKRNKSGSNIDSSVILVIVRIATANYLH